MMPEYNGPAYNGVKFYYIKLINNKINIVLNLHLRDNSANFFLLFVDIL